MFATPMLQGLPQEIQEGLAARFRPGRLGRPEE